LSWLPAQRGPTPHPHALGLQPRRPKSISLIRMMFP
jgi:hypothetical protein